MAPPKAWFGLRRSVIGSSEIDCIVHLNHLNHIMSISGSGAAFDGPFMLARRVETPIAMLLDKYHRASGEDVLFYVQIQAPYRFKGLF